MNHITEVADLIPGRYYWLRDKKTGNSCQISELKTEDGQAYFEQHIWALLDNNQAMERWNIFGPCSVYIRPNTLIKPPNFNAMMHKE